MEYELVPRHFQPDNIAVPALKTQSAAAVADHTGSQPLSVLLANDINQTVVVAEAVALAPRMHAPVLVKSIRSGRNVIESIGNSAYRTPLYEAREAVDVITTNASMFYQPAAQANRYIYQNA